VRLLEHLLKGDLGQVRDKEIEPPELGPDAPGGKIEPGDIGNLSHLGPGPGEPFFVFPSGQPGKTLFLEQQRDRNGAYLLPTLFQDAADIIDGAILFAKSNDLVPDGIGFGRSLGSLLRGKEEGALWVLAELVGENTETSRGIPEATGDFGGRELIDEVGPEGFVSTVRGIDGFEKEAGH